MRKKPPHKRIEDGHLKQLRIMINFIKCINYIKYVKQNQKLKLIILSELKFCPSKSKARDLKMCYKTLNIKKFTAVNEDSEY